MRNDSRSIHVRLNLNRPEHLKAWECLERLEREEKLSYNQLIARAITQYGERDTQKDGLADDVMNELVETCVQKIISTVEDSLKKTLPAYIAGCFAATSGAFSAPQSMPIAESVPSDDEAPSGEQILAEDIDWDFLGEG